VRRPLSGGRRTLLLMDNGEPTYTPKPGEFFVERTGGWGGRLIRLGTDSDVNHAGTYLGKGLTLEAEPGGARICQMEGARLDAVLWSGMNPALVLSEVEAAAVVEAAMHHVGDRYSWLDVSCIGLAKLTGGHIPAPLRARLSNPHMNMCSQLVDVIRADARIHLFVDQRLPGDVSPGDLRALISQRW